MKIAFLGIGLMGGPMVENLLNAGFPLTLWNRTRVKAEKYAERATIASTPAEAVNNADIIITMLENGPVVEEVLTTGGVVGACKPGAMLIDMSSIPPTSARQHAEQLDKVHCRYLDAPVSGGTVGAAQATLSIMVGGSQADYQLAQPVFAALGKSTYIGPTGSGQLAKLANQAIVGITIGAVSEALLLAAQGGANPEAVREALMGGFASSRILELHGQRMIERNFMPGARARVQLKDLRMILDEARAENLTLPLSQRVYDEYLSLVNTINPNVDHSGLLLQLESLNHVRLNDQPVQAPISDSHS
ncbi:MAG: NAD(P)-dependent oxidoreductase [Hahellaceae bacterium]|nr:NAD(P)-dependent oxidoreductase [Hahellaceae bacterium]MCP5169294.1 NAD(P)-dependent oxidoreductase [Hahellaceae bacterium]